MPASQAFIPFSDFNFPLAAFDRLQYFSKFLIRPATRTMYSGLLNRGVRCRGRRFVHHQRTVNPGAAAPMHWREQIRSTFGNRIRGQSDIGP
jgi:hypothetical protein